MIYNIISQLYPNNVLTINTDRRIISFNRFSILPTYDNGIYYKNMNNLLKFNLKCLKQEYNYIVVMFLCKNLYKIENMATDSGVLIHASDRFETEQFITTYVKDLAITPISFFYASEAEEILKWFKGEGFYFFHFDHQKSSTDNPAIYPLTSMIIGT